VEGLHNLLVLVQEDRHSITREGWNILDSSIYLKIYLNLNPTSQTKGLPEEL